MIEITKEEFNKRLTLVGDGVANDLRNELLNAVPVDTGQLKISIKVKPISGGWEISMNEYGKYVEFGTPPHIIKPKNKKALHWGGSGGPIVKLVHHPGTRPNPFVRSTVHLKFKEILSNNIRRQFT